MDEITMIAAGALRSSIRYQNNTANAARNVTANPTSLRILIFIIRNGGKNTEPKKPPPASSPLALPSAAPLSPKPTHRPPTSKPENRHLPPSATPKNNHHP